MQRRTLQRLEAAALARRAERVLHHVVDKGADLRRVEARSCALLRAQTVLHEVGEMAAPRLVHARGAERDTAPVERVDGLTREPSARIVRSVAHGGKRLGAAAAPLQITPRFPADVFARVVERTALRCKAVCLVGILRFDLYRRAKRLHAPDDKAGAQLGARVIKARIRDVEPVGRLGERGVEILQLQPELRHTVGRKAHVERLERRAVLVLQNAAAAAHSGQHMVVRTHQKQHAHGVAVVARHFSQTHPVKRDRDRADRILREHKAHEPRELLRIQLGTAQHLHKLVEHAAQNVPKLRQLLRPLRFAALPKRLRLPLQLLRQRDLRQIIVKRRHFTLNVSHTAHALIEMAQRRAYLFPGGVHPREHFLMLCTPRHAVALGVRRPRNVARPHCAANVPLDDVVFQQVALLRRKSREAGLEAAEHILVLKASAHRVKRAEQQRRHAAAQNIAAPRTVERDAAAREYGVQHRLRSVHIARGDGNIAEAVALAAHQTQNFRGDPLRLVVSGGGFIQPQLLRWLVPADIAAEEMLLHMTERIARRAAAQHLLRAGNARIPRKSVKLLAYAQALGEQLAVAAVAEQRHGDAFCPLEQNAQDVPLAAREVGKAVEKNVLIVGVAGGRKVFLQLLQPVARIAPALVELGKIRAVEQRHIAQPLAALARDGLGLFRQHLRRDGIGLQFFDEREQTFQKRRAL